MTEKKHISGGAPAPVTGLSRRQFLKAQAGLALAAGASGLWLPSRLLAAEEAPRLALAEGAPAAATRAAVEALGGMKRFVKPGQKVVVKPNMSFAIAPEYGTTTHPEVVREIVAMCKEAGCGKILVLDHSLRNAGDICPERSGIRDACKVFNEDMVYDLEEGRFYREAKIPNGIALKKTDVMKDVLECDVLIACPVAKSHSSTGVSLSLKGMMGLIRDRWVMHRDFDLSEAIVDLASFVKPHLVVIDATRVLTTNGPGGPGDIVRKNTVIASPDMVAADAQAVMLTNWYGQKMLPRQVKHIRLAHERGLGRMDVENLVVKKVAV